MSPAEAGLLLFGAAVTAWALLHRAAVRDGLSALRRAMDDRRQESSRRIRDVEARLGGRLAAVEAADRTAPLEARLDEHAREIAELRRRVDGIGAIEDWLADGDPDADGDPPYDAAGEDTPVEREPTDDDPPGDGVEAEERDLERLLRSDLRRFFRASSQTPGGFILAEAMAFLRACDWALDRAVVASRLRDMGCLRRREPWGPGGKIKVVWQTPEESRRMERARTPSDGRFHADPDLAAWLEGVLRDCRREGLDFFSLRARLEESGRHARRVECHAARILLSRGCRRVRRQVGGRSMRCWTVPGGDADGPSEP